MSLSDLEKGKSSEDGSRFAENRNRRFRTEFPRVVRDIGWTDAAFLNSGSYSNLCVIYSYIQASSAPFCPQHTLLPHIPTPLWRCRPWFPRSLNSPLSRLSIPTRKMAAPSWLSRVLISASLLVTPDKARATAYRPDTHPRSSNCESYAKSGRGLMVLTVLDDLLELGRIRRSWL